MRKRAPDLVFACMGLNIAAAQGLLIRVLLVSFSGNELCIGLILGNWMLAEALGSCLAGRFIHGRRDALTSFLLLQVMHALILPLVVSACYLVRGLAGAAAGEALGLVPMFWTSLMLLAPLSAVHGALFSVGCQVRALTGEEDLCLVGRLYVYEALGALLGGLALTFVLIRCLNPVQTGLLLSLFALSIVLLFLWFTRGLRRLMALAACASLASLVCLYLLLSPRAVVLHRMLTERRWGGTYQVVREEDSPYANIAVTRLLQQYTVLVNGAPVLTTPVPDVASVEEATHVPLLFHRDPRTVLAVGGGLGGVLRELLKYPLTRLDYAESDPWLLKTVQALPTPIASAELQDPRVHVYGVDGRVLLNQQGRHPEDAANRYDVVWVSIPLPTTLELNRFFTIEFFRSARQVLNPGGLFVISLPSSMVYIGPGLRDLNLMLRNTLRSVFPQVHLVPGDSALWLASTSLPLGSKTVEELVATWTARRIPTHYVTVEDIRQRLAPGRLAWVERTLEEGADVLLNYDLHPVGVLYSLAYWSEAFAPDAYHWLAGLLHISLWRLCLLAVLATLAVGLVRRVRNARTGGTVAMVVATTGFAGMVCDVMVVFALQACLGNIYQWVGLIIAAFMAGLAVGGWTAMHGLFVTGDRRRSFALSEVALVIFWLVLPGALTALLSGVAPMQAACALLLLNALGGGLAGRQFALSTQLSARQGGGPARTAGVLYSADLVGGFLGALSAGIVLIPALGAVATCAFVAVVKVCSLALFAIEPVGRGARPAAG